METMMPAEPERQQREAALLSRVLRLSGLDAPRSAYSTDCLLNHFGSIFSVLTASRHELERVGELDAMTAAYLRFFPKISARYLHLSCPPSPPLTTRRRVHRLLWPYFQSNQAVEGAYALCVDMQMRPLACGLLGLGGQEEVTFSGRRIVAMAMGQAVAGVFLAHNHPSGLHGFSEEDFAVTVLLGRQLAALGTTLLDHFLVEEEGLVSMRDSLGDDPRLALDVFTVHPWPLKDSDLWFIPEDSEETL